MHARRMKCPSVADARIPKIIITRQAETIASIASMLLTIDSRVKGHVEYHGTCANVMYANLLVLAAINESNCGG